MSLASKVFKTLVEEGAEEGVKSASKKASLSAIKKKAQQEFGTGISDAVQSGLKAEAKQGINPVTRLEAKEASAKTLKYAAQAVQSESDFFETQFGRVTEKLLDQRKNGEITRKQATDIFYGVLDKQKQESTKRAVSTSGASQTLLVPRQSETTLFMNKYLNEIDDVAAREDIDNVLYMTTELSKNPDKRATYLEMLDNANRKGMALNVVKNAKNFVKNMYLAASLPSRLWDAGANMLQRGYSLFTLQAAGVATKAGQTLAKGLPHSVLRQVMEGNGVYAGEAAKNLNGIVNAATDYLVQGSKNLKNFVTNNRNGIKETVIGKNARKIEYSYNFDRDNLVANVFLPYDMAAVFHYIKDHPVESAKRAYFSAGFGGTKAVDVIPSGAFRAGDLVQNAYHYARTKAAEVGKQDDKDFVDGLASVFIKNDNAEPLPEEDIKEFLEYFNRDNIEAIRDVISRESTEAAAQDVYRLAPKTKLGRVASAMDLGLAKVPYFGQFYDLVLAPFGRMTVHMFDRYIQDNPLSATAEVIREYKKAAAQIKATGTANSTAFYKAVGRLITGCVTYSAFARLVMNGNITGKYPDDSAEREMWRTLGIKEYAYNHFGDDGKVNWSLSFKKAGAVFASIGAMADMFNDTKKVVEDYENPAKPYGAPSAALDMIESFIKANTWQVVIGDLIEKTNQTRLTEQSMKSIISLFTRLKSNIEETFEMKDSDYAYKILSNTGKYLKDYKVKSLPRLSFYGTPIKDGLSTSQKDLDYKIANLGVALQSPELSDSATVDGASVELSPLQKYFWQESLKDFDMKDTPDDAFPRKTSVTQELMDVFLSPEFQEKGTKEYERDEYGDIVSVVSKKDVVTSVFSDCKKAALEKFLSYKDRPAKTDYEKERKDAARDLWKRAQETKRYKLIERPKPVIPTLNK